MWNLLELTSSHSDTDHRITAGSPEVSWHEPARSQPLLVPPACSTRSSENIRNIQSNMLQKYTKRIQNNVTRHDTWYITCPLFILPTDMTELYWYIVPAWVWCVHRIILMSLRFHFQGVSNTEWLDAKNAQGLWDLASTGYQCLFDLSKASAVRGQYLDVFLNNKKP